MTHTAEEIPALHRRLHEHCGKPALAPTYSDLDRWRVFLHEMEPLLDAGDLSGRFDVADLNAVMIRREAERKQGIGWGRMPSRILAEPEKFRDMVLEERAKARRTRPRPQPRREALAAGDTVVEIERDPAAEDTDFNMAEAMKSFADFREGRIEP
jgi:hypothetical protein